MINLVRLKIQLGLVYNIYNIQYMYVCIDISFNLMFSAATDGEPISTIKVQLAYCD